MKQNLVVLSGAGISAESGIQTFRDSGGLWEGYDVMKVATPEGWASDPSLVLDFYNQRRRQLLNAEPNPAHNAIVQLEAFFNVDVITQNVDDLHERAGSKNVLHLHGELLKARSTRDEKLIYSWRDDITIGQKCELGSQLRPHIVWFGEPVPMLEDAVRIIQEAQFIIVIGTSMQVYPAAGLVAYAHEYAKVYYIDPKPAPNLDLRKINNLKIIPTGASEGMQYVLKELVGFAGD